MQINYQHPVLNAPGWYSGVYLFIDYGSSENTVREHAHQLISLFVTACGNFLQDLSYPTIPYPSNLGSSENLEITIFHVPANDTDKQEFGFGYRRYRATSIHQYHYAGLHHFQSPMRFDHGTWLPGVSTADRFAVPTARYVGLFSSTSLGARDAWYDFAQRAMTDYECLGHIIDWIRSVGYAR